MSFTGSLGKSDSKLGNIVLGNGSQEAPPTPFDPNSVRLPSMDDPVRAKPTIAYLVTWETPDLDEVPVVPTPATVEEFQFGGLGMPVWPARRCAEGSSFLGRLPDLPWDGLEKPMFVPRAIARAPIQPGISAGDLLFTREVEEVSSMDIPRFRRKEHRYLWERGTSIDPTTFRPSGGIFRRNQWDGGEWSGGFNGF